MPGFFQLHHDLYSWAKKQSWNELRKKKIHLGVICNNKNSGYHVPTHTRNSIFLMQNQRFGEKKQSPEGHTHNN